MYLYLGGNTVILAARRVLSGHRLKTARCLDHRR